MLPIIDVSAMGWVQAAITLFFAMVLAHCMADFALQNDFMANAKNPNTELGKLYWPHVLFAHGMIHGGFVFLITGSVFLGIAEVIVHCTIDYKKCMKQLTFAQDQALHYAYKAAWTGLALVLPHVIF